MMEVVATVREPKARLSALLRQVEAGETVTFARHGKPVDITLETRLAALEQAGLLAWDSEHLPRSAPVAQTLGATTVAELLIEDRA